MANNYKESKVLGEYILSCCLFNIDLIDGQNWKTRELDFNLGLLDEGVELLNSLNWKWWNIKGVDFENAKVELVDVFLFMAILAVDKNQPEHFNKMLHKIRNQQIAPSEMDLKKIHKLIKKLVHETTNDSPTYDYQKQLDCFEALFAEIPVGFNELVFMSLCKIALNRFRNLNGYEHGAYKKVWSDGRQDNAHLMEWMLSVKDSWDQPLSAIQGSLDFLTANYEKNTKV